MNHIAKTLLNVMRIEVLLGIGLVAWVFSFEARAEYMTVGFLAGLCASVSDDTTDAGGGNDIVRAGAGSDWITSALAMTLFI